MRALWTAATGMKTQQFNIDTISNNLSNVNTTSYKAQRAEFKDLFYATLRRNNQVEEGGSPVNLQVGHGAMVSATRKDFSNGSFIETNGTFDVAIDGDGFFAVMLPNEELRYTRDGSFKLSVDYDEAMLVTNEGYIVLDEDDNEIYIESGIKDISIDSMGYITGLDEDGELVEIARLKIVEFTNPEGLLAVGSNLYSVTLSSGEEIPIDAEEMDMNILQGYLEASNVKVVDEMVKMITAQRAYEISSKAIQTSDEMLQLISNLKR